MCRRVNSEKPGPLRDRMEAMLYGGTSPSDADRAQNLKSSPHRRGDCFRPRLSRSEVASAARRPGRRAEQGGGKAEGSCRHPPAEPDCPHCWQAVRGGKDTIETMSLSGKSLPKDGVAMMRTRSCKARLKSGSDQIQSHTCALRVAKVQASSIRHGTQPPPKLAVDLKASALHPEIAAGNDVAPRSIVRECQIHG